MNEIVIMSRGSIYKPVTADGIIWTAYGDGTAGRLNFSVYGDGVLNFFEGDKVEFYCDGRGVFSGYVFTKKRDRKNIISVTAYDQLRYLKNKDTYVYSATTAAELIKKILSDVRLTAGETEPTQTVLSGAVEEEKPLIDIIKRAMEYERLYSGRKYVIYDDFGRICLKSEDKLTSGYIIDSANTGNFSYSSSIDENTYTAVRVTRKGRNGEAIRLLRDGKTKEWGILQGNISAEKDEDIQSKAEAFLKQRAVRTRHITVEDVLGDLSVRAGGRVFVSLDLGDIVVNEYFTAEEVTHRFYEGKHTMDIKLKGGEFIA